MSGELFDEQARIQAWPAWFQPSRHAVAQARNVARGLHPLGSELLDPEHRIERCGSCAHVRSTLRSRYYHKCAKAKMSHCPATDLRLKWPACVEYERRP